MKRIIYYIIPIFLIVACKNAYVLDIYDLHYSSEKTLVFGKQDIIIEGLRDSAFILSYSKADSSFHWKMNYPLYFRLNDTTINSYSLDTVKTIYIFNRALPTDLIKNELRAYSGNSKKQWYYVSLVDILNKLFPQNYLSPDSLKSVIGLKGKEMRLIILDKNVGTENLSGTRSNLRLQGDCRGKISLNFFNPRRASVIFKQKKFFHNSDTTFFTSVKALFTPLGASKFSIYSLKDTGDIVVKYDKLYRSVIPSVIIENKLKEDENLEVAISQIQHSKPYFNNIIIPKYSNSDTGTAGTVDSSYRFIPISKNILNYQFYHIDFLTFLYPFLLLISVYLFGFFIIKKIVSKDFYEIAPNCGEYSKWYSYYQILFFVLFLLCVGRIIIAYNLSYTYPYFEFAFPNSTIVSVFVLFSVLLGWVIIYKGGHPTSYKKKKIGLPFVISFFTLSCGLILVLFLNHSFFIKNQYFTRNIFIESPTYIMTVRVLFVSVLVGLTAIFIDNWTRWIKGVIFIGGLILLFAFLVLVNNGYSFPLLILITLCIWLLSLLYKLGYEREYFSERLPFAFLVVMLLIIASFVALKKGDFGYVINMYIFVFLVVFVVSIYYKYFSDKTGKINNSKIKKDKWFGAVGIIAILISLFYLGRSISSNYSPFSENYKNRLTAYYDFNEIQSYGTRSSEGQAQFFAEVAKYVHPATSNIYEPIHPGISNFTDPVVVNDVSFPFGIIYNTPSSAYWLPFIVMLLISLILLYLVTSQALNHFNYYRGPRTIMKRSDYLTSFGLVRIFAVSVFVSSTLWLIGSYYNIFPFTGRLIYGLGQDSMAEVFEVITLFVLMGLVTPNE
jgi:hypothetical protein